jgi:hypothetical protein
VPEIRLRPVHEKGRRYLESPGLIGCALAVDRALYDKLWGFDRQMRSWGIEDLDFGLKCWLMGKRILHAPDAVVGHRFRTTFDNYNIPYQDVIVNKLRMARKAFTESVWTAWLDNFQAECSKKRSHDYPEGLWAHVWHLFQQNRANVEQERAYLHSRRSHYEFWFAERFGLSWPRLPLSKPAISLREDLAASPSPPPPPAKLQLISPATGTTFPINATPAMPTIAAQARITGVTPDPTPVTSFTWTVTLQLNAATCPHGPARTFSHPTITQTVVGGRFTIPFTQIRGGALTISVKATVAGRVLTTQSNGLAIAGVNPPIASIQGALPHDTLRRIARLESGYRQFNAASAGGSSTCPLFSSDKLGGVGIMQLTSPAPTADQVWHWAANVAAGIQVFNQMVAGARNYPNQVRGSTVFQNLVTQFNQNRIAHGLPAVQVTLPAFTSGDFNTNLQQLEIDSIRGFNGWGGHDAFGFPLHEFRVAVDGTGLLRVNIDASRTHGTAIWERVPVADRPQGFGDPNYVNHVLAQAP